MLNMASIIIIIIITTTTISILFTKFVSKAVRLGYTLKVITIVQIFCIIYATRTFSLFALLWMKTIKSSLY